MAAALNLRGLGLWCWELAHCEGGHVDAIVARAQEWGLSWVAVKAGEQHTIGQVTKPLVDALRAGGIECAAWWYSHPTTTATELAYLTDLAERAGVRHFILDAEEPWEREPGDWSKPRDWRKEAAVFAQQLRSALGPEAYLADAPWARPVSHGGVFPYAEFGAVMNARMPQFYWYLAEVAGEPMSHFLATADLQWAQTAPGAGVCPIGSCVDALGKRHCDASELDAFLDRYSARETVSLWSWQHLSAVERALLAQRARRPVVPESDRPVFVAPDPEGIST